MTSALTARRTPLYDLHVEAGAKVIPFSGWEMPVSYDGIKDEHIAVRTHAGIFDVSHMGEIEVEGPGAVAFLQRLVTNDIAKIAIGGSQYSCMLNEAGGVIDDLFVYRLGHDRFLVVTNAGNHETDLAHFGAVSRDFEVIVRDAASNYAMLAVQGPNARSIVSSTLHIDLPNRMHVAHHKIGRRAALVCGTGYTGEDGVELLIDPEIAPAIWAELVDAGDWLKNRKLRKDYDLDHHARAQVASDQSKQASVVNLAAYAAHQYVMLNAVEEFREVHINAISVTLPYDPLHLFGSSMGGSFRAKAETRFRECRIEYRH